MLNFSYFTIAQQGYILKKCFVSGLVSGLKKFHGAERYVSNFQKIITI